MSESKPIRLVAFASGGGSNVRAIYHNIETGALHAELVGVISNNSQCGALVHARLHNIPAFHISRKQFDSDDDFVQKLFKVLTELKAELIVLAGYMKKMPEPVVRAYKNRMLNIHPALLPSFGGKGLYGHFVHEAVLNYGCKVSGVTVHLVDADFDTGAPVLQRCISVFDNDTPETLAARVLKEEHIIYSQAIQLFAEERILVDGRRVRILEKE
ncbi:phosphoribosylglycinamide formyltransferase [candidate division KSB1 bacterium]|nr:phosphoribosylglycinamide formyltransferase [candidate division KSB1 bacterium]RQV99953.1 MAG: phosphoribosylglycinamide formyltransferase [candidate division KSB1 bacterium]